MSGFKEFEHDLFYLVWGHQELNESIVKTWFQGLVFSEHEPTAIIQKLGGPCSVIAPIQAYLLKELLTCNHCKSNWRAPSELYLIDHLCKSLQQILENVLSNRGVVSFVLLDADEDLDKIDDLNSLHSKLHIITVNTPTHLYGILNRNVQQFFRKFGVLLLLYSVILTKGISNILSESDDTSLPLIDNREGHGSQNLLNLFLCGSAVGNVWDGAKEVGGLMMKGVPKQSFIGYLSLLESYKLCEVGWNLKNPEFPIWILGNELHLTVIFSEDIYLIEDPNRPSFIAQAQFNRLDKDGRGFINTSQLEDLLYKLKIQHCKDSLMDAKKNMDVESLGIITESAFMEYFFKGEIDHLRANKFTLFHYNGLLNSNVDKQVRYREASAAILDIAQLNGSIDATPVESCLRTKWPTIKLTWDNANTPPSLN